VEETATRTLTFLFRRPNYYGVSSSASLGPTGLTSLSSVLDENISHSFIVSPNDEYIYYAYPSTYGTSPIFKIGGFLGAVINIASGMAHTNQSGYVTNYEIYRSTNKFTANNIPVDVT